MNKKAEIFKNELNGKAWDYATSNSAKNSESIDPELFKKLQDAYLAGVRNAIKQVIDALESDQARRISIAKLGWLGNDCSPGWGNFIRDVANGILCSEGEVK